MFRDTAGRELYMMEKQMQGNKERDLQKKTGGMMCERGQ
jgi:hypothetical protein